MPITCSQSTITFLPRLRTRGFLEKVKERESQRSSGLLILRQQKRWLNSERTRPGLLLLPVKFVCDQIVARSEPSEANRLSTRELFQNFLRDRQSRSDFVSKASDLLWRREIFDIDENRLYKEKKSLAELSKVREEDNGYGFLKLSQARSWGSGVDRAPTNAKLPADEIKISQEDQRQASFLEYEALKREIFLLTILVGASCSIYCAIVFSYEACLSYGIGAMSSLLYLKLLFHHAGKISEDNVVEIFLVRRRKRIGIQSTDLQHSFEKTFYGSSLALSSPRLVIPASLFGLWKMLHQSSDIHFSLQLAPLMLGFFAYKGALLIQVYRDNKELAVIFPEEENKS